MTKEIITLCFRFILLILIQVLVLNKILFFGYMNPNLYILFIFLYPLKKERSAFLWISFLLGISIDFFSNSGGINAAATVFIAYIRLSTLKLILNKSDLDFKLFKLGDESLIKIVSFVTILTLIHHFILFGLDYFSWKSIGIIFYKSITTSIFTIILSILSILLFSRKKTANF